MARSPSDAIPNTNHSVGKESLHCKYFINLNWLAVTCLDIAYLGSEVLIKESDSQASTNQSI